MEYMTQTDLLERGWTKKLISTFLTSPVLKQNPYYRSGSPMKLYAKDDVEQAEHLPEFSDAFQKAQKRRQSATQAVQTKAQKTERAMMIAAEHIRVTVIPMDQLRETALSSKQNWYDERGDYESLTEYAPDETVNRWMVNYIRHHLTIYDAVLCVNKGRVGKRDVYPRFKSIVLQKIASAYPELKDECARQESYIY